MRAQKGAPFGDGAGEGVGFGSRTRDVVEIRREAGIAAELLRQTIGHALRVSWEIQVTLAKVALDGFVRFADGLERHRDGAG